MANFKELLRRTTNGNHQLEQAGPPVDLTGKEKKAIKRLMSLRNEFAHFSPKGWSVEISGLPEIASAWAKLMKGIHSGGWALQHCEDTEQDAFMRDIISVERNCATFG
ncbi:MAG TPA: hypothetical protein VG841_06490 [Caulobacterales bacterium]|nr:hypothetical protein [Caulobacterales bacterium]